MTIAIETPRLRLREYQLDDIMALHVILSDPITMQFWPAPFTPEATTSWIERQMRGYRERGYGRLAVIAKDTGEQIGDVGLAYSSVNGRDEVDLGYIIHCPYWRQGFALEAAAACLEYAQAHLPISRVVANMAHDNLASKAVAERLGMRYEGEFLNPRNRNIRTLLYTAELQSESRPQIASRTRAATPDDAAVMAQIYNQGIEDRVGTFETRPRSADDVRAWFDGRHPIVVVEQAGAVVAFASTSTYRPRDCYAGIAEFSVYVARERRGQGAGRLAMRALIDAAKAAGFWKLVSRVFVENAASRGLLRSLGFREVGIYEKHGQLDGVWRDVVIVERLIDQNSPEDSATTYSKEQQY